MDNVVIKKPRKKTKKYTFDQVFKASSVYFGNDPLPADVWADKYCLRDKENNYLELTPDDMHDRLAAEFARIDSEKYGLDYDERFRIYRDAVDHFARIVPQGSPSAALGNDYQIMSASNCVVIESPGDSIEGIMRAGTELAQLMKRRCVEENTLVHTEEKGPLPIKDIQVGMSVLSFDLEARKSTFKKVLDKFETDVSSEDRILVKFKSGVELRTSKKHPVLTFNQDYTYKKAGELEPGDVGIQPEPTSQFTCSAKQADVDLGWFIGCHIGDGSIDILKPKYGQPSPRYRFRNSGDNEAVIAEYRRVFNKLSRSKANYHPSYRKDYQTECWEYTNSNLSNKGICRKYFDGKFGSKTYTAVTPSFVREHGLWWPYLAGLLDSDGWIKGGGQSIVLRLCAKTVIDEIAAFLMASGVGCRTYTLPPRKGRENEQTMWGITIHGNNEFWPFISQYMHHDLKKEMLTKTVRVFSHTKPISSGEANEIEINYQAYSPKIAGGNLAACASLLRRRTGKAAPRAGIGMINEFHGKKLINDQKRNEILQRTEVVVIAQDTTSQKYYDIVVEGTNNFFAGNLGLVNIHNCGVGVDISPLRPEGFVVNNAAKTTSGLCSFADFFSYVTRMIAQKGRRGALMISIDVHHPDVENFARMKVDLKKVTGANISIRLSDEFLEAVENDEEYEQRWPCEGVAKFSRKVSAKQVWDVVVNTATATAEPGLLFWDRMLSRLPAHAYPQFKTICVNPCGEISLSAYDSCRLISINLTGYVQDAFMNPRFDWSAFEVDIALGMQMIDNLVDIELEQIRKIQKVCGTKSEVDLWEKLYIAGEQARRTGLGTHGLGDMLAQLCIKYDSQEALDFCERLYTVLRDTAYSSSIDLAEIRGSFPAFDWDLEKDNEFIKDLPEPIRERMGLIGRRNISILTQAPTGTTSMLSKCGEFDRHNISSGVEPMFSAKFSRRKKVNDNDGDKNHDFEDDMGDKWKTYQVYHGNILNYFEKTQGLVIESLENPDTQKQLEDLYQDLPEFFVGADDIDWKFRVDLQGVEQLKIDHSISSTVNLPRGTESVVVGDIYMSAWKKGLKGVTVYVDGSRDGVLITEENEKIDPNVRPDKIIRMQSPKRPKELMCDIHHHSVKGRKWVAFVGLLDGEPYEMFGGYSDIVDLPKKLKKGRLVRSGKAKYSLHIPLGDEEWVIKDVVGTFDNADLAWTTRLVSATLRHGAPIEFLVEQLQKEGKLTDFNKVLARVLKKYIPDGEKVRSSATCAGTRSDGSVCRSTNLIYQEGCISCSDCGYAKCG